MINNYIGTALREKRIQGTKRKNIAIPVGIGAVILASFITHSLVGHSSNCHDLERVTLIGNSVSSVETSIRLDELNTDVFSYQLPVYLDSENSSLYGFGRCPSP